MIVGNGLIGTAFKKYEKSLDICIHAAGVSNSLCQNESEFIRDYKLLLDTLQKHSTKKIVYFSSCSILDKNLSSSAYVQHKIKMEELIKRYHTNYLILRLPIVAGNTTNPNTLLNYLYNNITADIKFSVWKEAKRNVIDIDDITTITEELLNLDISNDTINVANTTSYHIFDIIQEFERILNKQAIFDIVNKTSDYNIDVSKIKYIINFDSEYLHKTIEKYYG